MKIAIPWLLLFALTSVGLGQPEASSSPSRNAEEEAVHKAVDEIVAALDRNDADAFERLSTVDYTFVNRYGKVWTKSSTWS